MEIQFHGANCLTVNTKKALISIDDNLADLGKKSVSDKADIVLFSQDHIAKNYKKSKKQFVITDPGEYEISEVSIYGIPVRAHTDEKGKKTATVFRVAAKGIMFVSLGHTHPNITDEQLEQIGMVDVLAIPVGGTGYTLDRVAALKLVREIDPKIVVPTYYHEKGFNFEVPPNELDPFVNELGLQPVEDDKLKLGATLPETMQLYKLLH